jgi:hypothetical protein
MRLLRRMVCFLFESCYVYRFSRSSVHQYCYLFTFVPAIL